VLPHVCPFSRLPPSSLLSPTSLEQKEEEKKKGGGKRGGGGRRRERFFLRESKLSVPPVRDALKRSLGKKEKEGVFSRKGGAPSRLRVGVVFLFSTMYQASPVEEREGGRKEKVPCLRRESFADFCCEAVKA